MEIVGPIAALISAFLMLVMRVMLEYQHDVILKIKHFRSESLDLDVAIIKISIYDTDFVYKSKLDAIKYELALLNNSVSRQASWKKYFNINHALKRLEAIKQDATKLFHEEICVHYNLPLDLEHRRN